MKILGLGFPELLVVLIYVIIPLVFFAILYRVIKAAVKNGTLEAHEELKRREAAQPIAPIDPQDQQPPVS